MKIVMKFGGSLLASKPGISRVVDIVAKYHKNNQIVMVVSALGETTDTLLEAAVAAKRWKQSEIDRFVGRLSTEHAGALRRAHLRRHVQELNTQLGKLVESLKVILVGVSMLGELTPRSRDLIVSFGERFSAVLVSGALVNRGIPARALTGGEAGIVTDDTFGEAAPVFSRTRKAVRRKLQRMMSAGMVPVVTGFIAQSETGEITTLGRGGSDYTATIIGDAIDADEVWIWTDVDGIMTANPRLVKNARVIGELSYAEAEEMAFFGAKNMHPLSLAPARLRTIPVRIKNGLSPEDEGTLIHSHERRSPSIAKSVSLVGGVGMLTVSGEILAGRPGTAAKIFELLGERGVNILMISQSVSESNISMVVKKDQLERAAKTLSEGLPRLGIKARVQTEPDVAAIQVVGAGMKGTPGVAARVFGALANINVNVRMVAQGSSELNISLVVNSGDSIQAIRVLHDNLVINP